MAVNDVYKCTLRGQYLGEEWVNVFFYRQTAVAAGNQAILLWQRFDATVADDYADWANTEVSFLELEILNMRVPTEFTSVQPTKTAGQRTATAGEAPSFLTGTIRFNRNGPGTRFSYKRLVGLCEEDIIQNGLSSAAVTALTGIGTLIRTTLINGLATFIPCQVRHPVILGVNPTVNFDLNNVTAVRLGTQNTRKG